MSNHWQWKIQIPIQSIKQWLGGKTLPQKTTFLEMTEPSWISVTGQLKKLCIIAGIILTASPCHKTENLDNCLLKNKSAVPTHPITYSLLTNSWLIQRVNVFISYYSITQNKNNLTFSLRERKIKWKEKYVDMVITFFQCPSSYKRAERCHLSCSTWENGINTLAAHEKVEDELDV